MTVKDREYERLRARRGRAANPDVYKNIQLKYRYGITLAEHRQLVENQNNLCAICKKSPPPDKVLHIDHDHETKKVRGLLCFTCNTALGHLNDDVDLLMAAISYLSNGDTK